MKLICLLISITFATISLPLVSKNSPQRKFIKHDIGNSSSSFRELFSYTAIRNYDDYEYYIQANIGTPPQTFNFLVSTGSAWIWLDKKNCKTCRSESNKFDPDASSSLSSTSKYQQITYLGQVRGYQDTETISIGNDTSLKVVSQTFVLVDYEWGTQGFFADGIIGFGFDALASNTQSLMTSLKSQGKINKKQFSVYLNYTNRPSDVPDLGSSMLMIDGYNLSKYSAETDFTYINLANSKGFWEISCDFVQFDNVKYTAGLTAIIDTGLYYIQGPKNDVISIIRKLINNYGCTADSDGYPYCNCGNSYPSLTYQLGGYQFTIQSIDYFDEYEGLCYLQFGYSNGNYWALGDAFLRRFYTNFDMDGMRIGFAKIGLSSPSNSSSNSTTQTNDNSNSTNSNSNSSQNSSTNSNSNQNNNQTSTNSTETSNNNASSSSNSSETGNTTSSSNATNSSPDGGANPYGSSSNNQTGSTFRNYNSQGNSDDSEGLANWELVLIIVIPTIVIAVIFSIITAIFCYKMKKLRARRYGARNENNNQRSFSVDI
ncbi:NAPSA_4 [Blepharisma stoltei]|uniref:Peptidase A1 domain-containing protein n=1 Tax=Blepharisma stoltei TaxID=1481888 RepID=A0AAU9IYR1_9CILI|nr:unnamed protein product [Blepharisma stoltei]